MNAMLVVLSYLMGSIPFGFWVGRMVKGSKFEARDYSSHTLGFMDFLMGKGLAVALLVLILDLSKGYVAAYAGMYFGGIEVGGFCLLATMLGHAKSLYFLITEKEFSGGKAVTCGIGGMLALQPALAVLGLMVFLLVIMPRYISLGSLVGSVAICAATYVMDLGNEWHRITLFTSLILFLTHWRNIARLLQGTEIELGRQADPPPPGCENSPVVVSSFSVHPLGWGDFRQSVLSAWIPWLIKRGYISKGLATWIIAFLPVMENAAMTGIEVDGDPDEDGVKPIIRARINIISILFLPFMIKLAAIPEKVKAGKLTIGNEEGQVSRRDYRLGCILRFLLWRRLTSAVVLAKRQGSKVFGLGALLSTVFGGGSELQQWANKRRLGLEITIDNGGAFTGEATAQAVVAESPVPISQATVAVIGKDGLIGRIVAELLEQLGATLIKIGRGDDYSQAANADIVVLVTSSEEPVVTPENCHLFKPGALFVDTGVPANFSDAILTKHPELGFKVVRGGLVRVPGNVRIAMDFHFGKHEGVPLVAACVAQTLLLSIAIALGIEGAADHATHGAWIRTRNTDFYREQGKARRLRVITREFSEEATFAAAEL